MRLPVYRSVPGGLPGLGCGMLAVTVAVAGCGDPLAFREVQVDSSVVRSATVTPDPDRSYEYDRFEPRVDSVLTALWRDGIPIEVAWRPIDYLCADARGERLTVQLERADARMNAHDFSPGTGRLACASHLMQYVVSGPRPQG